jgi:universal stress protein A
MMSVVRNYRVKQILLATDFSDSAEAALEVATNYARAFQARLHVLNVLSSADVRVTQLLSDAAAKAGRDVLVTITETRGDPAAEILRYARLQGIDVIVVGTHGRTGVSRVLLGSVAERVVRGALCPVLVVPIAAARTAPAVGGVAADHEADPLQVRSCLVCAASTSDLICEACRARIRGEALERKHREERAGKR